MISFEYPQLLLLLLLLPVVALWMGRRGRVAAVEYSSANVAREVARESRSRAGRWMMLFFPLLGAACFIVGLARPQVLEGSSEVQASGVDIMLCVGRVGLDAVARLQGRWPADGARRCGAGPPSGNSSMHGQMIASA